VFGVMRTREGEQQVRRPSGSVPKLRRAFLEGLVKVALFR